MKSLENIFNENINNTDRNNIAVGRMHYNFIPKPEDMNLGNWDTCKNDILAEYENIMEKSTIEINDDNIMTAIINKFKDSYEHQLVITKLLEDTFDEENAKAYIMDHIEDWQIIGESQYKNTGMTNKMISCNRYTFIMTDEFEETIVVLRDYETEMKNLF